MLIRSLQVQILVFQINYLMREFFAVCTCVAEDDEKMRKEKMKNIYGSNKIERYVLNNGVEIPAVAFGTYKAADGKSAT